MLSIIFSFRNEHDNLQILIDRTLKTLNKINIQYEIIFVDDDSDDNSGEIIKKNLQNNKNIKYIKMIRKFGNTPCLVAGMKNAKGTKIVYLDCDLQDPPELIEQLYKESLKGFDIINTKRITRKGENIFKMFLTNFAYSFINKVLDIKLEKNAGDFKLISNKVSKIILELKEREIYFKGVPKWTGCKEKTITYHRDIRHKGETKHSLLKSFNPYQEVLRAINSFSFFPVIYSLIISAISLSASFLLFLFITFFQRFNFDLLIILNLVLFGLLMFAVALIASLIHKNLHNTLKRPEYIIDEKIGID